MKPKKTALSVTNSFKILSFIFAAILISACSKKVVFPTSQVLPAADAVVKIDKNDDNNYEIELEVENMAKPDRLNPPRRTYVVWMVTERNGTVNMGNLKISNKLKGSLKAVTPFKPICFTITAEEKQDVLTPSTQVVLNSENFDVK